MDYLPLFLDVRNRKCLLVGGGEVAFRKAVLLQRAGASLSVVSRAVGPELAALVEQGGHALRIGEFNPADLEHAVLVVAATDDLHVNEQVSVLAKAAGIPVNVVDQTGLCSAIFPAIIDRNPVLVAISTGGNSPLLGRQLKEQLETVLPARTGDLASFLGGFRETLKQRLPDFSSRLEFWEAVFESTIPELVYAGNLEPARQEMARLLEAPATGRSRGEVYLVGAGPGDPDLLTLKALRLMQKADVVLYDRLVSQEIMQRIRPDARRIHVGKERAHHEVPQESINDMLVRLAREGKRVLRLKGGDPFIFGRGGEEMESLMENEIPFQVVPGITAASGCASYAGIPLTHRDHAQSVHFLTGHSRDPSEQPDWSLLARPGQTLVFYMGLLNLASICDELTGHGMPGSKPAALIERGTTPHHRVIAATLETLPARIASLEVKAPTLLIVGDVVKLHGQLNWFHPGAGQPEVQG